MAAPVVSRWMKKMDNRSIITAPNPVTSDNVTVQLQQLAKTPEDMSGRNAGSDGIAEQSGPFHRPLRFRTAPYGWTIVEQSVSITNNTTMTVTDEERIFQSASSS